ncbi:hypothetical protein KR038_004378, partial [Drosophila bunnanda]
MFAMGRWLLPLLWLISWTDASRILVIAPFESHSQCLLMTPYIRALVDRGHQLTVIHAFQHCQHSSISNVTYIRITDNHNVYSEFEEFLLQTLTANKWREMNSITRIMINASLNVLKNFEVRRLVQSNATFDLVVVEPSFTDVLFGLAAQFNAPLIGLSTCGADWNLNSLVGQSSSMIVEPLMPMGVRSVENLWDRMYNWYYTTEEWLLMQLVFLPKLKQVHDHFFGHLEQDFLEIRHGFALMLLNSHFSLFRARLSVPGIVEVAGFHIPKKDPKLPKDLQRFIDEAEHGVIYFALGVELQSRDLPKETQKMFLETFRLLPQRVIWKFEGEPPCEVADNIYLAELLPQQAILAHPNLKVFISHGGILSIIEAAYYGKPVLGMPVFFDQFKNIKVLREDGAALQVSINSVTGKDFKEALERLINVPSYGENSLAISKRFRDQPMHPMDVAIYWSEYIIRYRGANHMRVRPSHIRLIEYYSVDKFLMVGIRLSLVVVIVFLALSKWRCLLHHLVRLAKPFWPIYKMIRC